MSHEVFTVKFDDGLCMYGINDGTSCHMHRFLFLSHGDATDWISSGDRDSRIIPHTPLNASQTEESVIIGFDESWSFRSSASRTLKWITGPLENQDALDTWGDDCIYGTRD